jgi:hypothetical protein
MDKMKKKTIFRDDKLNLSYIRVAGFIALIFAISIGICGIIGYFNKLNDSILLITSAETLITVILGIKAWQKTSE